MQYVFDFCRDSPSRPDKPERLFFALLPDADTSDQVVALRDRLIRENRFEGTQLRRERLHVSLHHVGDYWHLRSRFVYAALQAASAIALQPFEIIFRSVGSFSMPPPRGGRPWNRPLVLLGEGSGLAALHERLGAAMERNGLRTAAHFVPHMTLFYGTAALPLQAIAPIHAAIDQFVLIHSALGRARHNVLGRWPLRAPPSSDGSGGRPRDRPPHDQLVLRGSSAALT